MASVASLLGHRGRRPVDEPQIARVDEEARALADDEDGIAPVDGIGEQGEAAADGEIPEGAWHDAPFALLGRDPLHDEAGGEQRLAEQADGEPELLAGHWYRRLFVPLEPRVA